MRKLILFSSQRVLFRLSWLFNFPFASPAHLIILVSKLALDYEKEFFLSLKVINNQSASQNVEGQYQNTEKTQQKNAFFRFNLLLMLTKQKRVH